MNTIANQIIEAIEGGSTPSWFPTLTAQLADSEWGALLANDGISKSAYSSSRILTKKPDTQRDIIGVFTSDKSEFHSQPILFELLPPDQAAQFEELGLDFSAHPVYTLPATQAALHAAFDLVAIAPQLYTTVVELVRSIHFLNPLDPQIDVSFSDPKIPFSIFISIPPTDTKNAPLRLAEAIVHEAMHLQLTLIEKHVPLIGGEQMKFFSPWKNERRKASGLLHALYVYTVIHEWLSLLSLDGSPYITSRIVEIEEQVTTIRSTGFECDLNAKGQLLTALLLTRFYTHTDHL